MSIFMDTGGGDIYAAETKEACIAAMLEDSPELTAKHNEFFEVPGSAKMRVENEDGSIGPISTLAEEYTDMGHGYCIAAENC